MRFIDKLIEETKSGELDFIWQSYGDNRFKYKADQHPLSDLNFSLSDIVTMERTKDSGKIEIVPDNSSGKIVFPNGGELIVQREKLKILNQECSNAVIRSMVQLANDYTNGTMQAELEAQAKEEEKKQQKSQQAKVEEKPINEK